MNIAIITSQRSTCVRRHVGCVLLDKRGHIISTGVNGVASGLPHCNEGHECPGAKAPSGTNLDGCHALHAEWNALLQCNRPFEIHTAYITTAPCITCTKLFLNTSCQELIFLHAYPHAEEAQRRWLAAGRRWWQMSYEPFVTTYKAIEHRNSK